MILAYFLIFSGDLITLCLVSISLETDMVEIDANNNALNIVIKPKQTNLEFTWGIAVWKPSFSQYLHDYLAMQQRKETDPELHIGHVIQAAINNGMTVVAETVSNEAFLDIGTPDDLSRAIESKEV